MSAGMAAVLFAALLSPPLSRPAGRAADQRPLRDERWLQAAAIREEERGYRMTKHKVPARKRSGSGSLNPQRRPPGQSLSHRAEIFCLEALQPTLADEILNSAFALLPARYRLPPHHLPKPSILAAPPPGLM